VHKPLSLVIFGYMVADDKAERYGEAGV